MKLAVVTEPGDAGLVEATLLGMKVTEVPTTLSPHGRSRPPHLRTWRDGWRTLRFFLLYRSRWLFLYPGPALMLVGFVVGAWLLPAPHRVGNVIFDVHTLFYAAIAILLGFQSIAFSVLPQLFAISEGLHPPDPLLDRLFRYINLELGLLVGTALATLGLCSSVYAVRIWGQQHFGLLEMAHTFRIVIPTALSITLGVRALFSSFFMSALGLRRR